jgi:hypothetical protein
MKRTIWVLTVAGMLWHFNSIEEMEEHMKGYSRHDFDWGWE